MAVILLDTSFALSPDVDAVRASSPVAMSAVTASELLVGAYLGRTRAERARNRREAERLLATVPAIPFDVPSARTHARLRARLRKEGREPPAYDLIIAATAGTHGYRVLTLNPKHFERVPGLRLAGAPKPPRRRGTR
jgi:predicted nucleic acid-binding protein